MKFGNLLIMSAVIVSLTSGAIVLSVANQDMGPKDIKLQGGKRGNVPFPHQRHQETLGDCDICHTVFPQKTGAIEELKGKGELKKKYVMNKLCTKCHKDRKKAGEPSGPTTCSKCHLKE